VLVVGSVPPPLGGHRDSLLAEVIELRKAGHEVEIVSPDGLSAAHRHLASNGIPGAVEIGLAARKADAVVVQLEPGLPVRRTAGRAERALALVALAIALRGASDVRIRLDHLDDLPGGPGGRAALELWKSATRIDAGDEAARGLLVAVLGSEGDRVVLAPRVASPWGRQVAADRRNNAPASEWGYGADVTADTVMTVVRRRAAAERASISARADEARAAAGRPGGSQHVPLWEWLPWPGAGAPDLDAGGDGGTGTSRGAQSATRRVLVPVLAAAERRPLTRPLAVLARAAWGRWKASALSA
jgi:hypothetical protein